MKKNASSPSKLSEIYEKQTAATHIDLCSLYGSFRLLSTFFGVDQWELTCRDTRAGEPPVGVTLSPTTVIGQRKIVSPPINAPL